MATSPPGGNANQPCYVLLMPQQGGQPGGMVSAPAMQQYMPSQFAGAPMMVPMVAMPQQSTMQPGAQPLPPPPPPPPPAYTSVFARSATDQSQHASDSRTGVLGSVPPPPMTSEVAAADDANKDSPEVDDASAPLGPGNASINPNEFWANGDGVGTTAVDGAPTGGGSGGAGDPACEAMIADLRKEKTDRSVRTRVIRLPTALCAGMVHFLAASEELMNDLCMRDRGIIVAHLVERLGPESCQPIIQYATNRFMALALNQSGCIALPRIMASVQGPQLQVFFDLTMQNLPSLIDHPFGNYIVKHFASLKDPIVNQRLLNEYFVHHFVRIATNKYGSHVLEDVLRVLTVDELYPFARTAFADVGALRTLAHDRFANYCIQTMFRVLATGDARFHSWCVGQIIGAVRGSPYEQNIMKSAVAGYRGQPPPPPGYAM